LHLLADGEPLMVKEIAQRLGEKPANVSNHMKMLAWAGIVRSGSGRLYRLTDTFKYAITKREIDFGYCVLRLDVIAEGKI
jgi:DNA-binding IclR family transcriptional regulator